MSAYDAAAQNAPIANRYVCERPNGIAAPSTSKYLQYSTANAFACCLYFSIREAYAGSEEAYFTKRSCANCMAKLPE